MSATKVVPCTSADLALARQRVMAAIRAEDYYAEQSARVALALDHYEQVAVANGRASTGAMS